ncbi:pyridoxal-dependent decarboxylase [bacterium]|nr:pyridoxal-dependent decarboxylase [bacterium]
MDPHELLEHEETLDPADWDRMRNLGHRMVDDIFSYLQTVRDRPIWRPTPEDVKKILQRPLPEKPEDVDKIYHEFLEYVLPYPMGNIHPRFWGWVIGTGTPLGMLAEMLAAGMNPNLGGGDHVANYVEAQVLDWCKEMFRFPKEASGLLVSGGSMANLMGLAVARNIQPGTDIRSEGVGGDNSNLTIYFSTETHSSADKAVELLGLGRKSIRKIPVNADYEMNVDELERVIVEDKANGYRPFCVVGTAGTVNTGAFDDLVNVSEICREHDLWLHVDGAFGAMAKLLPEYREQIRGMEQADSIAFDFHKWMYIPYEAGCILVKNSEDHKNAFKLVADYLLSHERGVPGGPEYFSNFGFELSRGFKALKIWFSIKEHGIDKYRRLVRQNIAQAQYLAQLVERNPDLQLMAPVPLNVVCYRFASVELDEEQHSCLNKEILMRLHEEGIAVPSFTLLDGKYVIRAAITNHRSRKGDFDLLVQESVRIGKEVLRDGF